MTKEKNNFWIWLFLILICFMVGFYIVERVEEENNNDKIREYEYCKEECSIDYGDCQYYLSIGECFYYYEDCIYDCDYYLNE